MKNSGAGAPPPGAAVQLTISKPERPSRERKSFDGTRSRLTDSELADNLVCIVILAPMSRGKRTAVILMLIIWFPALSFSQTEGAPSLSVETGVVYAYNITTSGVGAGQRIGLGVRLAENLSGQFIKINGDGTNSLDYTFVGLSYGVVPWAGARILVGGAGFFPEVAAMGAGVYAEALPRHSPGLSASLRASVDFVFTEEVNLEGSLIASVSVLIGI